jgi:thiosulfate/3-mercaptopyruvate sulfurtransferase
MTVIDCDWLASNLDSNNLIIIDARGKFAHRFGHIENSLPLDIEQIIQIGNNGSHLVIEQQYAENIFSNLGINNSKTVVVYGDYPDPSVARMVWTLNYFGHEDVKLLDIGFAQWERLGLPVNKYKTLSKKTNPSIEKSNIKFIAKINPFIRADAEMIKEKQNNPDVVIVDARTPQEHFQARIPGSLLNNWENGLGDQGVMIKDKESLKKEFLEKGITQDKEVICYCHSGMRASHTYLQFKHAGFRKVRLYDGSIIDWAQRHNPLK